MIKLTVSHSESTLYINPAHISYLTTVGASTKLSFGANDCIFVIETPEEILKLIGENE